MPLCGWKGIVLTIIIIRSAKSTAAVFVRIPASFITRKSLRSSISRVIFIPE
jgi:hypothetical protein